MNQQRLYRLFLVGVVSLLLTLGVAACNQAASISDETQRQPASTEQQTAEIGQETDDEIDNQTDKEEEATRPEGWSEESHSNDVDPNYAVVFPEDEVKQMTITIAPEDWAAMQANMTELFGEPGQGEGSAGFPGGAPMGDLPGGDLPGGDLPGDRPPAGGFAGEGEGAGGEGGPPEGFSPPAGGLEGGPGGALEGGPGGLGGLGGGQFSAENPMWVPGTIEVDGETWTNVGVRYKGNSSLRSGWNSGTEKLPLKLDFDEFEDDYPEIDDQRFYGFKQLSLANGFSDASFLRDAATYEILDEAGLPAAETAFYEVFLDYGEGPVRLGLYVVIEVIDDTVVDRVFGDDDGNIYEGEGSAASFALGTEDQIEESFQKENNRDEADWSDLEALYQLIHSDQRTADPEGWRASLEEIFDVEVFLEWLAIKSVIEHWDTYGAMAHNYYLYNDSGQLTWISWDHNMTMSDSSGRGPGSTRNMDLDGTNISEDWPLIRYLLDDPVYYEAYLAYMVETVDGAFDPDQMAQFYTEMATLIEPYASADVGEERFHDAVQYLIDYAYERTEEVEAFLNEQ